MTQSAHSLYPVSLRTQQSAVPRWISVNGTLLWRGQGRKAREMNEDGVGQSYCVLVLPLRGSAHKTESAGLSAWRQQKERPFLDMISIGVLSLCTKSEFGAGKCSVQRPEQNEMG